MRSWFQLSSLLFFTALSLTAGTPEAHAEPFVFPGTICQGAAQGEEAKLSRGFTDGVLSNITDRSRTPATAFLTCPLAFDAAQVTRVTLSLRLTVAPTTGISGCNLNAVDFSTTPPQIRSVFAGPRGSGSFLRLDSPPLTVGPNTTLSATCTLRAGEKLGSLTLDAQ